MSLSKDAYMELLIKEEQEQREAAHSQALVLCPRCEKHTNSVTASEYLKRNPQRGNTLKLLMDNPHARPGTQVCEFCGWKLPGAN